jgi:pimeloyl-ACP methyl ester carboxylesterase
LKKKIHSRPTNYMSANEGRASTNSRRDDRPGMSPKRTRARRRRSALWTTGIAAAVLVLAFLILLPAIKTYLKAVAVLLASNGSPIPRVLHPLLDSNVRSERVSIPVPDGGQPIAAILYTPSGSADAPGMVIVSGLDPGGIEGLSPFARLEASTGLRVLTPDIPKLDSFDIRGVDKSAVLKIGESARWLDRKTGEPVSIMGISFGGGLSIVAAARKEYAHSIKAVFDIGGFDDLSRVAQFYFTGKEIGPDGQNTRVQPKPWVSNFLEYTDLMATGSRQEISDLAPILKARIVAQQHHPKGKAQWISNRIAGLNPDERRELETFLHPHPARIGKLLDKMAPEMQAASPRGHLRNLTADVYVLHGLDDNVIPSEEALWLQKDLPPGRLKQLLISPLVSHVNIAGNATSWKDKWSLVYFMYKVHRAALAPYGQADIGNSSVVDQPLALAIGSAAFFAVLCLLVLWFRKKHEANEAGEMPVETKA